MQQQAQTLAAFVLENGAAARRLLEAIQKVDEVDDNVKIVDAAIAERTKFRGRVKVHQTEDMGALKGGVHGAAIGVVVGAIIAGPAGAVAAGAAGGLLHSLRSRFHDIGIDDKFMQPGLEGDRQGQERPLRPVRGQLGRLDRADRERDQGRERAADPEHAAGREGGRAPAPGRAGCRGARRRRGRRRLRGRGRGGAGGGGTRREEAAPVARRGRRGGIAGNGHAAGDDLTQLVGIGPKAAAALTAAGITTYAALAETNEPQLRRALHEADMMPPGNVGTWPMQASYATKGDWQGLMKHNEKATAKAKPAAAAAATAVAAPPDDLTQINGIGPRISSILNDGRHHHVRRAAAREHRRPPPDHRRRWRAAAVEPRQLADPGLLRGARRLVRPGELQPPLNVARVFARAGGLGRSPHP